jgi:hypothetical protein
MNQHEYEENRRRWLKARLERTVIDALKMAAVVGALLIGLVGAIVFLSARPIR